MAHSIVLEWDPQRVRAVVGASAATSPTVQQVVMFSLDNGEESDEVVTMAESIATGLKQHRLGKGDAVVIVERSVAELRVLCVPPVPAEELPAVVNFQANREFTSLGDGWLLDYVPLPSLPNGQQRVLAGAISPQVAAQVRGCCDKAGLNLKKVILRPFASARLLAAAGLLQESCLLVELLEDSAELTVFHNGSMQLTRSVRTSAEAPQQGTVKQVVTELKRTLTSFRNQQQDADVQRVLLMVPAPLKEPLLEAVTQQLSLNCEAVDPWELFKKLGSTKGDAPEKSECLAAVLGGLCEVAVGEREIDFVNPTRPPTPPSHRRRNLLFAATAATLLLSLGGLYWMQSSQLNKQIEMLRKEVADLSKEDQKYQDRMKEIDLLDQWVLHRVNWLEEMGQVSRKFPLPDDAIVDNLGLAVNGSKDQAVITMVGRVASTQAIRQLEEQLRNPELGWEISGKNNSPTSGGPYKFRFDETLTIDLKRRQNSELDELASASLTAVPDEDANSPVVTPAEADQSLEVDADEVRASDTAEDSEVDEADLAEADPDETDPDETDPDETDPDETDPDETDPDETDPDETDPDEADPDEADPIDSAETTEATGSDGDADDGDQDVTGER